MSDSNNPSENKTTSFFSKFFKLIVPMNGSMEQKLGWSLGAMFTTTIFIYSVSRLIKDRLVVADLGGEVIPLMKNIVTFSALLFSGIYVLGISYFNRRQLFNIILGIFLGFFAFFGLVIYPYQSYFLMSDNTMNNIINWLGGNTGIFFNISIFIKMFIIGTIVSLILSLSDFKIKNVLKNIITYNTIILIFYSIFYYFASPLLGMKMLLPLKIVKIWPFALYYIFSEMWGVYGLSMLFWNFCSYQVQLQESKNVYPFIIFIGQVGQILSGFIVNQLSHSNHLLFFITISIIFCCGTIFFFHEYLCRTTNREIEVKNPLKTKKKPSFSESLQAMKSSPIILLVSFIGLIYGITCNILEVYWKSNLKDFTNLTHPTNQALAKAMFSTFQAKQFMLIGVVSMIVSLLSAPIIKKMGWKFAALITPVTVFLGTILFFGSDIIGNIIPGASFLLKFALITGTIALIFVKSTKYTVFDTTKEMLFITLPSDVKSQGKIADSFFQKNGKTLGSQSLFVVSMLGYTLGSLPIKIIIGLFMLIISFGWILMVFKLDKFYSTSPSADK